jgi:2,3,4,5-tetrahydropyridine-2-carboxylate N-succinyltransferase
MFYSVGLKRSKEEHVLDVVYMPIRSGKKDLASITKILKITQPGVYPLTAHQLQCCRDLLFTDLPIEIVPSSQMYSQLTPIFFWCDTIHTPIQSTEDAYFKLQLLSQRKVKPHVANLDGLFAHLLTLAWTNIGPVLPKDLPQIQLNALCFYPPITVTHVDKFPYMVNYHVPSGVRIANASGVRLGAYLSEGTTVMPAGFVNFNAGTLGNAMVEGRISAGVVVGEDSDIGGGASIMGTLSGGNNHVISVGKKCLLGANSGIGVSLGDGCTVGAGVYLTAGKKVSLYNEHHEPVDVQGNVVEYGRHVVKALELSGTDYRLFIEDSQTGELLCKPNLKVIALNSQLHAN